MKRGDIFTVSTRGLASKPRPAIILTADEFLQLDRPVILCPLTSTVVDARLGRIRIEPSDENGLHATSEAMLERLGAALPNELGRRIGQLGKDDIDRLNIAVINVLGLAPTAAIVSAIGKLS
ncbi:type II toxin-antitoxin system PemK/MazF family toxin [Aurantimonas sp. A2-1-M11]|uniref:type II toxin-antitoxin system PemK/MazF family toxin n=1 Tax=Aurantimonas sp. A2-1-M11 TaxID=3113712 RepID=UPI002F929C3A